MNETKNKTVVLHFSAAWCGPCKAMEPTIQALKEKHKEQIDYQKVDVDVNPEIAEKYSVRSVPTLIFIDGEAEQGRVVGGRPATFLEKTFEVMSRNEGDTLK